MTGHTHSVSVAGIIIDDANRALLIQRRDNARWEPPGGVLEHGERITDGLKREVLEETGLSVEPGALTGVYKNMPRDIIALVFRCKATTGELRTNSEVAAFRWASKDEIANTISEAFAVRVLDAFEEGKVSIREHDGVRLV